MAVKINPDTIFGVNHCVSCTVLTAFHSLSQLNLKINLRSWCEWPHFAHEGTEAQGRQAENPKAFTRNVGAAGLSQRLLPSSKPRRGERLSHSWRNLTEARGSMVSV